MDNAFQSLGTLLNELLKQQGLDQKVKAASVPDVWNEVVGENVARATRVKKFEFGKLIIEVSASVWRAELMLRKDEIRRRLNERIGNELVKEIILR